MFLHENLHLVTWYSKYKQHDKSLEKYNICDFASF